LNLLALDNLFRRSFSTRITSFSSVRYLYL